ncbi:hypothetical protein P879_04588 [Paragonimus westermani]|uniref:Uncharacterized protein n=1 Tax=Paragonimus westermani TaxID=34504 RepID=A0A8T0DG55_9TREM|nr:hypothetical protein P879_04588 [Paragonimus westermani]
MQSAPTHRVIYAQECYCKAQWSEKSALHREVTFEAVWLITLPEFNHITLPKRGYRLRVTFLYSWIQLLWH